MACRTESKNIGEHEFSVTQWPAEKAMLMKLRLIKTFGGAIAGLASESDGELGDKLDDCIASMFKSSTPEEIVDLIKTSVIGVACDGKRITPSSFEELFSGDDLMDMYKVFGFVVQVNFKHLMQGQQMSALLAKAKSVK